MIKIPRDSHWLHLSILILLGGFFFFFHLGHSALIDYDEATYAQVFKESAESGDYLSFTYLGRNWFEKPPLYFWMMAVSARVFGFSEGAMRLPSALFGLLTVVLIYLTAFYLTKNKAVSFLAGLILLLSGEFVFASRQLRMDVPVVCSIVFSVYCFIRGWDNPKWFLGFGAGAAAGFLFKSVVGFLVFPMILIIGAVYRNWSWIRNAYFWLGVFLIAILLAPWHVYQSVRFGWPFWSGYFGYHIIKRFVSPVIGGQIGVSHYVKYLFMLVEPWMVLFVFALIWFFYDQAWRRSKALSVFLAMSSFVFLIFAAARTKLFYYLEPIYPFLAVFLAAAGALFYQTLKSRAEKRIFIGVAAVCFLLGAVNTTWQAFYFRQGFSDEFPIAAEEREIGRYLASRPEPEKAFALNWFYFETIRYYSQGREIGLLDENSDIGTGGFFLLMPTELKELLEFSPEFSKRVQLVGRRENLTLFEVAPAAD